MRRLALLFLVGCEPAASTLPVPEVRAARVEVLPAAPDDPAWSKAPLHLAELRLQDLVEPRRMKPGAAQLRVQALTDGRRIAFRLAWKDATADDVRQPARFSDACAVQFPAVPSTDLPAPQMGEKGRPVEITYWSAALQAAADGRPDDLKAFYPNAQVDHYPFAAPPLEKDPQARDQMARLYAPARSLGNFSRKPVQELVAQGPGTLAPAPSGASEGQGRRDAEGWRVVLSRPLPAAAHVAFAVWDGAEQDVGSRKLWVPWTPLKVEGTKR